MRRSWTLGGSVAGLAIVASMSLGAGTAQAADCSQTLLPLLTGAQRAACLALLGGGSSAPSSSSSGSSSSSSGSSGLVPRVVQGTGQTVGGVVGGVTPRAPAAQPRATRAPTAPRSNAPSAGSTVRRPAAPAPAAAPVAAPAVVAPVAAAPDYGTLLSSSYDRVPTSLLGTAAPAGGAGASLIAPASYDPGLLLSGTPGRNLAPAGAADGVTTTSSIGPVLRPDIGSRVGTPLLLGVLAASTVIALAVRSAVLRRSRVRPA